MAHELNLSPVDEKQAGKGAALVGSLIPLIPFLFAGDRILMGILGSLDVSALTLFCIGWYRAKMTVGRPHRSGLQMLIIGISSALAGFGVAYLVSGGRRL